METKSRRVELPTLPEESCSFEGYDAASLMAETAKLRKLITKKRNIRNFVTTMLHYRSGKIYEI
jgi:hypothetical protein